MVLLARPRVRASMLAAAALLLAPLASPTHPPAHQSARAIALRPAAAATMTLQQRQDRFGDRVLTLVNQRRAAHHLRALRMNRCVHGFADDWASSLARRDAFEHSDLGRLIARCDTPYAAENIAQVPPSISPRGLVRLWMHSADHRHNILSRRPTATGVGIRWDSDQDAWVAVQNFARRPGSYPN